MKIFNYEIRKAQAAVQTAVPNGQLGVPMDKELFSSDNLRSIFGSFNGMLPNPDPIMQKLGVNYEWEFYQAIKSDDMVATCLESLDDGVLSYEWEIYQDEASDAIYELVWQAFERLNLHEIISQISETPAYGRQYLVVDWEYLGGYWLPKYVESYPLELFEYDEQGYLMYQPKDTLSKFEPVPPYRVLNPRHHPRLRSPMGESVLSKCYWNVFFKKNAKTFWNISAERFGMPWVLGKYDSALLGKLYPSLSAQDAATQLVSLYKSMVRDAVMVLPNELETTLTNTSTTTSGNTYKSLVDECNDAIARVLLGHTGSSTSTPGSLGNENGAMEVRSDKIEMRKRLVIQTFNELIKWIAEVNTNETALPVFRYKVSEAIRKDIAEVDQIIATTFGVKVSEEYLIKNYHYTEGDIVAMKLENDPVPSALAPAFNQKLSPIVNEVISGRITDYDALGLAITKHFPGTDAAFMEACMAEVMKMSGVNYGS